jgi:hypothetical protein
VVDLVDSEEEIRALWEEIEEIKASLPAHSVSAGSLQQLEELEDRLRDLMEGGENAQD